MSRIAYSPRSIDDLDRVREFCEQEHDDALAAARTIIEALSILERHPLIGRPAEEGMRELVISRGRTGYVALYDYLEPIDSVVILDVRHQREAGYE